MKGQVVVLAGAALLLAALATAGEREDLRAIGEGRALYLTRCASCHGEDVRGASAPDLTTLGSREGPFRGVYVSTHITGRRDGSDAEVMPCWGRVFAHEWPRGEGPALLKTWKLVKYLEFVQASPSETRVAAAPAPK